MTEMNNLEDYGIPEHSPMTEISLNLGTTTISKTNCRKRRLSLSTETFVNFEDIENIENENVIEVTYCTKMDNNLIQNSGVLQDITNMVRCGRQTHIISKEKSPEKCTGYHKENIMDSPSRQDHDISLYGSSSPSAFSPNCSPSVSSRRTSRTRNHQRTKSHDETMFSLDSGISSFHDELGDETKTVNFVTRDRGNATSNLKRKSLFRGLSDLSQDENFMDVLDVDLLDQDVALPLNFDSLVSGPILTDIKNNTDRFKSPPEKTVPDKENVFERSLSCDNATPVVRKRSAYSKSRTSGLQLKRYKSMIDYSDKENEDAEQTYQTPKSIAKFSISDISHMSSTSTFLCSPDSIISAVHRSTEQPDLIGDFTKPFVLPLISGSHQDLKSISGDTLAKLLKGDYGDTVESFKIIDCRYPYEYDGGHIFGAVNFYKKEQIESEFFNDQSKSVINKNEDRLIKRNIIIFHCEFSAQRGPKLFRFLREVDRSYNNTSYPALCYPEVYLLEGGYKKFYEKFSELCIPKSYLPMADPAHHKEYRLYRAEKYSFNSQAKGRKLSVKRSALEF